MNSALVLSAATAAIVVSVFGAFYFYLALQKREKKIIQEREESTRRLYELAILKELGERVGYSLDVEEILRIITGSLRQFIDYSVVGYTVITPEKLKVNLHIDKSVSQAFLNEMKEKMLGSLSALTEESYKSTTIDEVISGALVVDEIGNKIGSLFNIPLSIGGSVAGVLTIAHVKSGLYKEEDMTILYKITGQASEAVSRLQEVVEIEKGKLNAMVESMGDGVLMVDKDYQIVVANPAIRKAISFDSQKNKGKDISIFDFVDALGGKFDIHGRLEEAVAKKVSYVSERINMNNTYFEIGVYPVAHFMSKEKVDQVLGAVVVFHDVTRDIELERVREEFTGMIVHELRSPLNNIKKVVELILSGSLMPDSDKFREYLNMTHQSSASMLELVNDILDLSKLQAGKFEVTKLPSDIRAIVENRITFYKISADTRKVSLSSFLHSGLPEKADFDPQAMKQVLNNYLSNALKFTSSGGSILVSAFVFDGKELPSDLLSGLDKAKTPIFPTADDLKVKKSTLCVVVSDTGIGIPAGDLKGIFQTYKQAKLSPIDKESKGTGLGLVIAKGIAEAHGGTIGAVSQEGQGSSFFFTIPIEK